MLDTGTTASAALYAAMVRATDEQRRRLSEQAPARPEAARGGGEDRWSSGANRFREDPFREHDTLDAILSFIRPDDVVLDIGGGAGRYLPIALRCREMINVEPSPGMGAQWREAVAAAGIGNARLVQSDWEHADVEGDVAFTANVVYYIEDIVPFLAKLQERGRRRVMIVMHSVPPTNIGADIFRLVHGFEPAPAPGHRQLLPVLWDMGILPDVRVLGPSDFIAERERYPSREAALDSALRGARLDDGELAAARERLEAAFDRLFVPADEGYRRRPAVSRVLLVTWETNGGR